MKITTLAATCMLMVFTHTALQAQETFSNPLPVKLGDPFVLKTITGKYFLYGTGGVRDGYKTYSSDNLVNWKDEGPVFQGVTDSSWGVGNFWAPEVFEHQGKFYMFYSADWRENPNQEKENFRIGVAVADKPTGPFTNLINRPIFDPGYPIIDADVFFDANGRIYLTYSRCCYKHAIDSDVSKWAKKQGWYPDIEESWVYGIELKPDLTGVIGKPAALLQPPTKMSDAQSEWESRSVTSHEVNRRWTEGSCLFKQKGTYYLMYSANFYGGENYAVGYATSKHPLGPYKKANNNPVLQKNTSQGGVVTGTGHNSVTTSPDGKEMYCIYHGRTQPTGMERLVFIDKMEITAKGQLVVHGPTTTPQAYPAK